MEDSKIIIPPDPMTKEISTTSIVATGVILIVICFACSDMPVAGILIGIVLLGLQLLLILEFLTNICTIILTKGGCTFKLGKHQWSYCSNELNALVCTHNRFLTHGDALDGPGVIISAKPLPAKIRTDARSYCGFHAPLTSVFIRFSQDDDDEKITYQRGGFSSKGHTANKDDIMRWLSANNIKIHQC